MALLKKNKRTSFSSPGHFVFCMQLLHVVKTFTALFIFSPGLDANLHLARAGAFLLLGDDLDMFEAAVAGQTNAAPHLDRWAIRGRRCTVCRGVRCGLGLLLFALCRCVGHPLEVVAKRRRCEERTGEAHCEHCSAPITNSKLRETQLDTSRRQMLLFPLGTADGEGVL